MALVVAPELYGQLLSSRQSTVRTPRIKLALVDSLLAGVARQQAAR
ncbi:MULTISPECIES: hypothetical protein [unclassified Pseudomonas]|nr:MULTISPECIES: hypothetical protein [unclassified Pseudomonas]MCU1734384.1 hypothetical protein [Pseudomonas sp. 20P_3.2_Bac4]MCU1745612.1 hypothetical protein [Pseudomonas sp. 20P_3.2_Bac5]